MKPNAPDPESDWENVLRRARADTPPPIDLAALQRVVRDAALAATPATRAGWAEEFTALFATPRTLIVCLTLTLAGAALTSREVSEVREAMPWVALISTTVGGAP